jgi:hypothetical protein
MRYWPFIFLDSLGKITKNLRMAGDLDDIRTELLAKRSLKRHFWTDLFNDRFTDYAVN